MSRYIPALSFRWLTPIYDPLIKWVMREEVIKRRLVQQANFQPHQRILDLGCGTGTLTLMVKQTAVSAEVHALDGDPQVLQIARTKARQAGSSIAWVEGLTYDLPYEDESFERVISSLVIHHLSTVDKLRTFKESLRVLKPGGELHILDFGPAFNQFSRLQVRMEMNLEEARDNFSGHIPFLIGEAGFSNPVLSGQMNTVFGPIAFYQAVRPVNSSLSQ